MVKLAAVLPKAPHDITTTIFTYFSVARPFDELNLVPRAAYDEMISTMVIFPNLFSLDIRPDKVPGIQQPHPPYPPGATHAHCGKQMVLEIDTTLP